MAQPTGTQRSARRLMAATLPHLPAERVVVHAPEVCRADLCGLEVKMERIPGVRGTYDHLWEQVSLPWRAHGGVIWTLMGSGPCIHPGSRHVMVVHDLNFILLPNSFSTAFRTWYRLACGAAARRADIVVCFTEYVKGTLISLLRLAPEKIYVIPQGPGLAGVEEATRLPAPALAQSPYFLCVGSLQPHKNLAAVLLAWASFSQKHPAHRLVIVGRKQARFSDLPFDPKQLDLPRIEFTGYVDDARLIELYRGAAGFLYPSFEEGFGLPVVEAFYCGCPVITSDASCLPEVAGDAALLVDPRAPEALTQAMHRLVSDLVLRNRCVANGYARAERYSWLQAGKQMAAVLNATLR